MEAVDPHAVRVEVGEAGRRHRRDRASDDRDDRVVRASLRARVEERDVPVHLTRDRNLLLEVCEQALDRVAGVHASTASRGTDARQGAGVAEDDRRGAVQVGQELVDRVERLVLRTRVRVEVAPVDDGSDADLGRRAGERLVQAVEAVRVRRDVTVDDGVLELRDRRLDRLLHVQRDAARCGGTDLGEDTVDLERATEGSQGDAVLRGRDVLGRVLRVVGTERGAALRLDTAVTVVEGCATASGVDDVLEDEVVEDRGLLAELVDRCDVQVLGGVLLALSEGNGHDSSPFRGVSPASAPQWRYPGSVWVWWRIRPDARHRLCRGGSVLP
ncbi:Uncharacterised protein [Streptococcus pyogenes]|nr:Uncharacterised protein [Streptococcus pyogenes]